MSAFHLFVYGTLRSDGAANDRLAGCTRVADGVVRGTLYDIDGRFPALLLYGSDPVHGEVWQCAAERLAGLDAYEQTESGLFRRNATEAETADGRTLACWVYTAGPALSRKLTSDRRLTRAG